ncbi:hypothetical protein CC1G_05628 [Coprinopsis cinerea okayama7|uniref:Cytochrome P450 n=1 Tax=Coprinopsis cinerea (strain Okayama-7 / 130 / ATCC MYA-4618 / FGSC 9003) TaxID=240176 RepID=A8P1P7_COPC7|nr:hypothetical protein CC1G_05628 [Coprinopsis cinerea okayama7\|eukprot:XP_001838147.2 hypothetical protein CC1G_05628 [Coprinopsis cinerea okayama7\
MINILGLKKVAFITHPISVTQLEREVRGLDGTHEIEKAAMAATGLRDVRRMVALMSDKLVPLMVPTMSSRALAAPGRTEAWLQILDKVLADTIPSGRPTTIPLYQFIAKTMFSVSSAFLFGSTFPTDTYQDFVTTLDNFLILTSPISPYTPFLKGNRARDRLLVRVMQYLQPCWAPEANVGTVLSDAHDIIVESVQIMKDANLSLKEAAGTLIGFHFGLHGNVWFHMYQMLGRVLLDPDWRTIIQDEIRTNEDVANMKLLESTMHEALRRPFRIVQLRTVPDDTEIYLGGTRYFFEKGTVILPKSFTHDETVYKDPFEFRPDRFLDPQLPKARVWGEGRRIVSINSLASQRRTDSILRSAREGTSRGFK